MNLFATFGLPSGVESSNVVDPADDFPFGEGRGLLLHLLAGIGGAGRR